MQTNQPFPKTDSRACFFLNNGKNPKSSPNFYKELYMSKDPQKNIARVYTA
jgi:hypothetical protein